MFHFHFHTLSLSSCRSDCWRAVSISLAALLFRVVVVSFLSSSYSKGSLKHGQSRRSNRRDSVLFLPLLKIYV